MATCRVCDQPIEEHVHRDAAGRVRTGWAHTHPEYPPHEVEPVEDEIPEHLTEPPF
jgi:hypothetical protein